MAGQVNDALFGDGADVMACLADIDKSSVSRKAAFAGNLVENGPV